MKTFLLLSFCALGPAAACGGDDDGGSGGADAAASSCASEMFDTYGVDAFLAVNDSIIEGAVAAPTSDVGTSFQDLAAEGEDRVEEFRTNLASFLVKVYGGPDDYTGPSMEDAHGDLGITSAQYDFFVVNVVVPALQDNGVPQSDIDDCFAPPVVDPAFKATIVTE